MFIAASWNPANASRAVPARLRGRMPWNTVSQLLLCRTAVRVSALGRSGPGGGVAGELSVTARSCFPSGTESDTGLVSFSLLSGQDLSLAFQIPVSPRRCARSAEERPFQLFLCATNIKPPAPSAAIG